MSRTAWLGMQDPLKHMLSAFVGTNAGIGNTCQQTSNLKPPSVPLVFTCGLNVTGNSTGDNTDMLSHTNVLPHAMSGSSTVLLDFHVCVLTVF